VTKRKAAKREFFMLWIDMLTRLLVGVDSWMVRKNYKRLFERRRTSMNYTATATKPRGMNRGAVKPRRMDQAALKPIPADVDYLETQSQEDTTWIEWFLHPHHGLKRDMATFQRLDGP
jgi:hypothetical protein